MRTSSRGYADAGRWITTPARLARGKDERHITPWPNNNPPLVQLTIDHSQDACKDRLDCYREEKVIFK